VSRLAITNYADWADSYDRPYLLLSSSAKEEFAHLPQTSPGECDAVILGLDPPSLSYEQLNIAFRILKQEPLNTTGPISSSRAAVLIAPHALMFQQSPSTDTLPAGLSLGIGPFVKALESASGLEAEIVGKPTRRFFNMARERLEELYDDVKGMDMREIAVVGDDIDNDLGEGARDSGLARILGKVFL
jgi:ribonucleotide monophosphatase NagD (HAD superfamily)